MASWHPILVHAPLIFIPLAVVLSAVALVLRNRTLRLVAAAVLVAGVVGAVLAAQTGGAARHQAGRAVRDITISGAVPSALGNGSLVETHATLGSDTQYLYGLLLVAEVGLIAATEPTLAPWRRGLTIRRRWASLARGLWLAAAAAGLVLVMLTGYYGGQLVYDHGVGVATSAITRAASTPDSTGHR